jgi:hypothetical protein
MVRLAEAKTRAQKLGSETRAAADALHAAETRSREMEQRLKERRPAVQRELARVAEDETRLKELTRKVASLKGTASLSSEESRSFEVEIEKSREEIDERRCGFQSELDELTRGATEARKQLQAAMEHYQALRKELDRLQPQLAPEFTDADSLARAAETLTPAGQVRALAREVEGAIAHFGMLDPREQLLQLTLWIGRFRRLQAFEAENLSEEDQQALQRIFPRLVGISKQYEPGYIEAFRQTFHTDWDKYIADAEEQFRQVTEAARQRREAEMRRREQLSRDQDRQRVARLEGETALDELRAIMARYHLPDEGLTAFYSTLDRVILGMGASDPQLLELVLPYRDLLTGAEYRAVRKHLDRLNHDESREEEILQESFKDLLELTRGRRALMIGGAAREDMRRTLQRVFEFEELDWESYEDKRPVFLESLKQRVKNRSIDMVLILKSFIAHHVPEQLRPLCEQSGVPCLMIEHGYGPAQVAETLRRGLVKSSSQT